MKKINTSFSLILIFSIEKKVPSISFLYRKKGS